MYDVGGGCNELGLGMIRKVLRYDEGGRGDCIVQRTCLLVCSIPFDSMLA